MSFVFPRVSMLPDTKSRETLRLEGKQNSPFPEEYTLSVLLCSKERKINNTYTIIVFHDIMTINRKFYSVNETFEVQNSQNLLE